MKRLCSILFLLLCCGAVKGQTLRYFQFHTGGCNNGAAWQDTSFIAATADTAVIDSVLADLAKPTTQRRMITGKITYGDGGYNHNASHWFLWHFIENQWYLADISLGIYDGCPYTGVDADTSHWIGQAGYFNPIYSYAVKEIGKPADVNNVLNENDIVVYPNPASNELFIKNDVNQKPDVSIYNVLGQVLMSYISFAGKYIDVSKLADGFYFIKIQAGDYKIIRKVEVNNK
jgi:hypothetical protein